MHAETGWVSAGVSSLSSLQKFSLDLDRAFDKKVIEPTLALQKKVSLEALRRVIEKSPVLTGRFRGNWQVAVGVRPTGELEVADTTGSNTLSKGSRPITSLDDLDTIYIVNNLPYAEKLDQGSSQQAPAGMIAVTVAEINAFFNEVS